MHCIFLCLNSISILISFSIWIKAQYFMPTHFSLVFIVLFPSYATTTPPPLPPATTH